MSNFELQGRPSVRVRSIAAWDRLRADYDLVMLNLDGLEHYWPIDALDTEAGANFDSIMEAISGLEHYWKMDVLDVSVGATFDAVMLAIPGLEHFWKIDQIGTI